ncbi:MAG: DUF1850 domain-containing protein [Rubrivivax sp.]|nr:DUF1850 domain-containing protein [Rubrivivax sp.]
MRRAGPQAGAVVTRAAVVASAAAAVLACSAAAACELRAQEHRSGREVLRASLAGGGVPEMRVSFVHSVLGTPVEDRYQWRAGTWLLVEERFEGEGYGLPHTAGPGERLERTANGWRLHLERQVEPLVVRPLLAQRMRLSLDDGRTWLLGQLTTQAVELRAEGCRADGS